MSRLNLKIAATILMTEIFGCRSLPSKSDLLGEQHTDGKWAKMIVSNKGGVIVVGTAFGQLVAFHVKEDASLDKSFGNDGQDSIGPDGFGKVTDIKADGDDAVVIGSTFPQGQVFLAVVGAEGFHRDWVPEKVVDGKPVPYRIPSYNAPDYGFIVPRLDRDPQYSLLISGKHSTHWPFPWGDVYLIGGPGIDENFFAFKSLNDDREGMVMAKATVPEKSSNSIRETLVFSWTDMFSLANERILGTGCYQLDTGSECLSFPVLVGLNSDGVPKEIKSASLHDVMQHLEHRANFYRILAAKDGEILLGFDETGSIFNRVAWFKGIKIDQVGNVVNSFGQNGIKSYDIKMDEATEIRAARFDARTGDGFVLFNEGDVIKLDQNGDVDVTFGENGRVKLTSGNYAENMTDLVVDDQGLLYVASDRRTASGSAFIIRRLTYNGHVDTNFGNGGSISIAFPDQ